MHTTICTSCSLRSCSACFSWTSLRLAPPCEWWEAAPFDEGAFATLKTEVEEVRRKIEEYEAKKREKETCECSAPVGWIRPDSNGGGTIED